MADCAANLAMDTNQVQLNRLQFQARPTRNDASGTSVKRLQVSRSRFEEDLDWSLQAIENLLLMREGKTAVGSASGTVVPRTTKRPGPRRCPPKKSSPLGAQNLDLVARDVEAHRGDQKVGFDGFRSSSTAIGRRTGRRQCVSNKPDASGTHFASCAIHNNDRHGYITSINAYKIIKGPPLLDYLSSKLSDGRQIEKRRPDSGTERQHRRRLRLRRLCCILCISRLDTLGVSGSMANRDDSHIAALQAALAAVEDWDGDLSALFGFDSDNSSSSDVSRPKKPRTRPYERPKQEVASLRAEIAELENVIALEKTLVHDSPEINGPTMEEAALEQEWQRLASTQKHEWFVSQLENARLRKQLNSQTKNMEKILNLLKRLRFLEETLPELSAPSFDDYRMPSIDAQAHLQRLVSLLPFAVEIFSSRKFAADGLQCFRDIHVRGSTPAVNGADFDIKAAYALPFPVDRVANPLWL